MRNRIAFPIAAAGLALLVTAQPAAADDTELFLTGLEAQQACEAPNVLFIIDTSGSMAAAVETQVSFDPDVSFGGCFDSDQLYYSATGELPDCDSELTIPKSDNFCAASLSRLQLVGRYKNLFRRYDEDGERWEVLDAEDDDQEALECEADRGVDGGPSQSETFAADGPSGPWSASADNEPSWAAASDVTIFDGNWLNWNENPPTEERTRLQVVQDVTSNVIDSVEGLNIGVMSFNFTDGGRVDQAVGPVETTGEAAKAVINNDLVAGGFTPLSETLYEAGQYLGQRSVDYGDSDGELSVAASRLGGSVASSTYLSPIDSAGERTFIVLVSDGEPAGDEEGVDRIEGLPEFGELVGPSCDGSGQGRCLDDMAEYLLKRDLRPDIAGLQNVITHTIGFTTDLEILENTAARGGGRYFLAEDTATLTAVLTELAESFTEDGSLFSAPTVPVNAFDQSQTTRDVYVSVFGATTNVRWPGNLKRYGLVSDADGSLEIVDQFGQPAVDPDTGFFAEGATSVWSEEPDGNIVELGGAASQLPDPDERTLLTNIAGGDLNGPGGQNAITIDNAAITAAVIGAPAASRDNVIEWARGRDVLDEDGDGDTDEARLSMGDPLHSQPAVVSYGSTADDRQSVVYITTNEGLLHAIEAESGEELWAFMPSRQLGRLFTLFSNNPAATRNYGLDGNIRIVIENSDGQPGITGAERVILVFGMRRGGDSLFAVDVTDRNRPELLWEIDDNTAGFSDLGQTWTAPRIVRVNVGGSSRFAGLLGGGYDTGQDTSSFREDTVGNAVFLIDVVTGELLWSAGRDGDHDLILPAMRFSIPAVPTAIELGGDEFIDKFYVGDMGGQVWRFDINNGESGSDLVEGGVLASVGAADLGASPAASELRRFYESPDVVLTALDQRIFIAVNIGSGYRAHPLDTSINEQFFSIWDASPFDTKLTEDYGQPITVDDLADATDTIFFPIDVSDAGWRFGFPSSGEKVLTEAFTFAFTTFFVSFTPEGSANFCQPAGGVNRLYQVSLLSGAPLTNLDEPLVQRPLDIADRSVVLQQGGIAPRPILLFSETGQQVLVGAEGLPDDVGPLDFDQDGDGVANDSDDPSDEGSASPMRTFWVEEETP